MLCRAIGNSWKIIYREPSGNFSIRKIKIYDNKDVMMVGRIGSMYQKQLVLNVYDLDKNKWTTLPTKNIIKWY